MPSSMGSSSADGSTHPCDGSDGYQSDQDTSMQRSSTNSEASNSSDMDAATWFYDDADKEDEHDTIDFSPREFKKSIWAFATVYYGPIRPIPSNTEGCDRCGYPWYLAVGQGEGICPLWQNHLLIAKEGLSVLTKDLKGDDSKQASLWDLHRGYAEHKWKVTGDNPQFDRLLKINSKVEPEETVTLLKGLEPDEDRARGHSLLTNFLRDACN